MAAETTGADRLCVQPARRSRRWMAVEGGYGGARSGPLNMALVNTSQRRMPARAHTFSRLTRNATATTNKPAQNHARPPASAVCRRRNDTGYAATATFAVKVARPATSDSTLLQRSHSKPDAISNSARWPDNVAGVRPGNVHG